MASETLLDDFIAESKEHLAEIEQDFISLEKHPDQNDPVLVNRIFRHVHTIKGSSGFLGLTGIGAVAHAMETALSRIRDGEVALSPKLLDVLLEGLDLLNGMVGDWTHSNDVPVDAVVGKIMEFTETVTAGDASQPPPDAAFVTAAERKFFLAPGTLSLKKTLPERYFYQLSYNLKSLCDAGKVQSTELLGQYGATGNIYLDHLFEELLEYGEIHEQIMEVPGGDFQQALSQGTAVIHLLYSTILELDMTVRVARLPGHMVLDLNDIVETDLLPETTAEQGGGMTTTQVMEKTKPDIKTGGTEGTPKPDLNTADSAVDSLRVRVDILDKLMMLAGELVLVRNQQLMHTDYGDTTARGITQRLNIVTSELQENIMRTRMQPLGNVFSKFNRIVRDLGRKLDKKIDIETIGNDVELDKNILEALSDPLTHIIRNSCDHGIESSAERRAAGKPETGLIRLRAYHEGGQINVEITDDGKGIDKEALRRKVLEMGLKKEEELARLTDKEIISFIFLPGLTTTREISDLSGRGVGMDVVKTSIERVGGLVDIQSEMGKGTQINLRLPLTLAIIPSLIVQSGANRFAIPQINLEELVCLYDEDVLNKVECAGCREVYRLRNSLLTLLRLDEILAHPAALTDEAKGEITERYHELRQRQHAEWLEAKANNVNYHWSLHFAVLKVGNSRFGLIIDRIVGTEEIVVKPMHRMVKDLSIYSGATVLGDGKVALILDVQGIARHTSVSMKEEEETERQGTELAREETHRRPLLLFRNSGEEQFAVGMEQIKRVERIEMSFIEHVGEKEFITIDGVSTRVLRLDHYLNISSHTDKTEMFLLLPKRTEKPYGILMGELIDIGEYAVELQTDILHEEGVSGSALIKNKLTLLLDPERIARIAEPQWYEE